jgi:hypothetical protein
VDRNLQNRRRNLSKHQQQRIQKNKRRQMLSETLEDRRLLAVFNVANEAELRAAIIAHNGAANMDPINEINLSSSIALTNGTGDDSANAGDLDITKRFSQLVITGATANAADTVIDQGNSDRVFQIFQSADVVFRDLTISGGDIADHGGGIRNDNGTMTLDNVILSNNRTTGDRHGGGFWQEGPRSNGGSMSTDFLNWSRFYGLGCRPLPDWPQLTPKGSFIEM